MNIRTFFQKKTPLCGLDLGSSWAKAVKLSSKGKSPVLDSFARLPWASGDLTGPAPQGAKIKTLWQHLNLKDKVVVSSMAGHSVIVKRVYFDSSSHRELEQNILKEAGQYIPYDVNDVYMDYQIMGDGQKENSLEVMLVACKKKVVQDLIDIMEHSALSLGIVDVDAFALSNCFEFNYPELREEPVYLLDIGDTQSIFVVFWKNQPVFFRELSFGGRNLTDIIGKQMDISRFEAEKIKIQGPSSQKQSMEDLAEISRKFQENFRSWADEIRRLIGFYQTSTPEAPQPDKIFLSGGGSLFKGINSIFTQELEVESQHLDPWKMLQKSSNDFDTKYLDSVKTHFAVATGLAIRGLS
ncbi:MAG: type IV pilus assembly protein PilM [Desulfonatronovibrio sp.]